ncbi:MAG: hypothetical protein J7M26_10040, partial [Armatimonadetes bacterium]|nr:hypothetical protein [Armatimonadota bacterium]
MTPSFVLLWLLLPAAVVAVEVVPAPVVVLCEPGLPYYMANPAVTPPQLAEVLRRAGLSCRLARAKDAAVLLRDPRTVVFVNVYGATYPEGLAGPFREFHRRGGCLVTTGV